MDLDDNLQETDICRVCRSEGTVENALFHPCLCMGSIKYIHQDCLVQWLKFSKKEFCELCHYKFSFTPIYSNDMPNRLPIKDLVYGLMTYLLTAIKYYFHYSIVAIGWLVIVPSLSYRVIKCLFNGSFYSFFTLPIDVLAYDKLIAEEVYGAISVMVTVMFVIGIIWLRELIIREIPDWLVNDNEQNANNNQPAIDNLANNNNNNQAEVQLNNVNNNNNNLDVIEQEEVVDPVEANEVDAVVDRQENELIAVQEDGNWNEEITFERIFGLDGSLLFLEHIFWIISLNAFFVFVFAFVPYHIGLFCLSKLDLIYELNDEGNKLEKVFAAFVGYLLVGILLVMLHYLLFKFSRARRLLGIGYLVVKVLIVTVMEIGIFPIFCGFLIDIFSLPLFGSTIYDREAYFRSSPGLSTFIHWCMGFAYILYITSFLLVLKEIIKPELVSLIETFNNDLSPVLEIIHLSVVQIIRRYIFFLTIFVFLTFIMIFLPVQATEKLFSNFLPYNIFVKSQETSDISLDLWRLHIITPLIYDYSSLKICIKSLVYYLCVFFAYLLDLKSFLLKNDEDEEREEINENNENVNENQSENAENQEENENLLASNANRETQQQSQTPNYLYLRLFGLFNLVCITIFLFGFLLITVPTFIGRKTMALFVDEQVSELYTVSCGLYIIILNIKIVNLMIKWLPKGWIEISNKLKDATLMFFKTLVAAVLLCGFLPLTIGFLFEVMIFVPIRVSFNQTPIYYLVQDWLLGILIIKVIILLALFNEWNLRDVLEEFYQAGFVNIDLKKIITKFILPVFFTVGLVLSIPYVFVYGFLSNSYLGFSPESLDVILRKIYLSIWCSSVTAYILQWQFYKFLKLYDTIKNQKYLIGRKLINYDGNRKQEPIRSSIALVN